MKTYHIYSWLLSLAIIIFTATYTFAQHRSYSQKDIIHLKNGSIIKGQIIEYNPNTNITIETEGGSTFVYPSSDVLKIEQTGGKLIKILHKPIYPHLYHTTSLQTFVTLNNLRPGIGLNTTTGWHFHRLFGMGIGTGVVSMGGNTFVPIYANIKGDFMPSSASLFYNLDIGYGICAILASFDPSLIKKYHGGFYMRPAIGIRFPSTKNTHIFMDLGLLVQNLHVEFTNDPTFKQLLANLSLQVGITF